MRASPTGCWRCSTTSRWSRCGCRCWRPPATARRWSRGTSSTGALERGERPAAAVLQPPAGRAPETAGRPGRRGARPGTASATASSSRAGSRSTSTPCRRDPDFWSKAARQVEEQALANTLPDDWRFDTLIIDEAQDFEGDWFEAVRLFLREDAAVLWLEDPNQNVRGIDAVALQRPGIRRLPLAAQLPLTRAHRAASSTRSCRSCPSPAPTTCRGSGSGRASTRTPRSSPAWSGASSGACSTSASRRRTSPSCPAAVSDSTALKGSRARRQPHPGALYRRVRPLRQPGLHPAARSCSTRCAASKGSRRRR